MKKINKHIEIVVTSLPGYSSMSEKSSVMLKKVLRKNFTNVAITVVDSLKDLERLVERNPDLAFIGLKKIPVGDSVSYATFIWIARYLESYDILTTGSGSDAIELEQDKAKAKDCVINAGISTSRYFFAKHGQYEHEDQLPLSFPLFIKPHDRGAGVGIDDFSVVRTFSEFQSKVFDLETTEHSIAMVENFLNGREFTVGVMLNEHRDELITMPIEQLPAQNSNGDRVIGKAMKDDVKETAVALISDEDVKSSVSELARSVFLALGARDYGRIDIRLDENGTPHFLEANLIPGLINGSGNFQKASQLNLGMSYEQMILHIVNLAFSREEITSDNELKLELQNIVNPALLNTLNV